MEMFLAGPGQLADVYNIVHTTIETVYPHYYPAGAVNFFLSHHQRSHIEQDIRRGCVYLFTNQEHPIATCTVRDNELCRFFVLPQYQHQGYGRAIMEQMEQLLWRSYDTITLAASLPALSMYCNRGYRQVAYIRLPVAEGDYLCYWTMELTRNEL